MTRRKEPDTIDWAGALARANAQFDELMRAEHPVADQTPPVTCRCGAVDRTGRDLGQPADLRNEPGDVTAERNEGARPCRGCPHYIHHDAMCVIRYFTATSTVRDYYHPDCVRL